MIREGGNNSPHRMILLFEKENGRRRLESLLAAAACPVKCKMQCEVILLRDIRIVLINLAAISHIFSAYVSFVA